MNSSATAPSADPMSVRRSAPPASAAVDGAAWRERPQRFAAALLLAALLVFQLGDTATLDLQFWDESRLAVNAIEMLISGNHLVTTYGFVPDLWNTKPPLLINLMVLSMQLLGPSLFALRLPSALAACGTVILVTRFTARETGSAWTGLGAGVLTATSRLVHGYHAGQTGDYDALLTLMTTAYGIALYRIITAASPQRQRAAVAGALVGLAVLTKSIAGLVPGVGIAGFALLQGPRHFWRHLGDYAIVAGVAGALGGGYYLLRVGGGDGYLVAVATNDLMGRYVQVLDRHAGPPDFYLSVLLWALPWPLLPALAGLLLLPPGAARRLAGFALCQLLGVMLVYSSAATKIYWYIAPALPFYTIAAAIAGLAVIRAATEARVRLPVRPLQFGAAALLVFATGSAIVQRYLRPLTVLLPAPAAAPLLAAAVQQRPGAAVTIVDDGVFNDAGFAHYVPTWRFHALAAGRAGRRVAIVSSLAAAGTAPLIGSCDPRWRAAVTAAGTIVWQGRGCVLIERPQPQPQPQLR